VKFEVKRTRPTPERPHGLRYALTLHDPDGRRLVGFDNAHGVPRQGSRFRKPSVEHDHWHRTVGDQGGRTDLPASISCRWISRLK
jgi:hypothetical protein